MSQEKYIGLDVHQATISVAVMDAQGKLIMDSVADLRGRNVRCLVTRPSETPRQPIGGL